ncbi:tryptophan 2,3-dioxygenase family protein [Streptomyces sp. ODS05-4]|uniref:tryptophan 2,3-dioxygenase family protein n=1 Tax=Streptomyces sp. ODS05-4 TaxID=2944939 RepID=UPI00210A71DD|nr:tryptophan 2,3-dioxygenase family protein [Streptomyces sp. ODS05-4]
MTMSDEMTAVAALRSELDRPIYNRIIKRNVGEGELDYERYVRTPELLSLQPGPDHLVSSDELMFLMVHQAQEIWLKLTAHELAGLVGSLDRDDAWTASAHLSRAVRVIDCLVREIKVLETLTPDSYQVIRRNLGNGSGQESPGYNQVNLAASYVGAALDRLADSRGIELAEVYGPENEHPDLKHLVELLVDFDEGYQLWLVQHFMLVRRTIGVSRDTAALDGIPTTVLPARMTQPLFRRLWKLREEMTAGWKRGAGYAPGASREDAVRG